MQNKSGTSDLLNYIDIPEPLLNHVLRKFPKYLVLHHPSYRGMWRYQHQTSWLVLATNVTGGATTNRTTTHYDVRLFPEKSFSQIIIYPIGIIYYFLS